MASVVKARGSTRVIIQLEREEAIGLRRLLKLGVENLTDDVVPEDVQPKWRKRVALAAILIRQLKQVTKVKED